jgi:hypothetical protein
MVKVPMLAFSTAYARPGPGCRALYLYPIPATKREPGGYSRGTAMKEKEQQRRSRKKKVPGSEPSFVSQFPLFTRLNKLCTCYHHLGIILDEV